MASKAIGVAENLRRRNININPYCSSCCLGLETSDHILFSCPNIIPVWRSAGFPTSLLGDPTSSVEDKLRYLIRLHHDTKAEPIKRFLPFWVLWRLWKSRNDLVFNKKTTRQEDLVKLAINDTIEWMTCLNLTEEYRNTTGAQSRRDTWTKPPPGWIKCNYDASHIEGNNISGLSWIIRDSNGFLLHCGMGKFQGRTTIEESECTALIWAIQSTRGLGYRKVIFEGDNINITQQVNNRSSKLRLKHYLDTIEGWKADFETVAFSFRHREQNHCADKLAKQAIVSLNDYDLYHSCPFFLQQFVNNDTMF
ncbi:PREDICTED: uncharacterized protein LOC104743503 [Camelina sativa]|uniref:Uncharacterized protein LOC104743503 n=1 Tax=Camelina sativa TaxID=90675 RepID=A0ABM0VY38_CAMSA|nr:PREDICTED: uncharacterized protein LOC104743503 [Camelina sativa]